MPKSLPAGFQIQSMRLNGEASRRPLYVLYRTGHGALASSYNRRNLVTRALEG